MTFGTLYGHPLAGCFQRVIVVANEIGVELSYSIVDVTKGEHKQEPHISRQPFGLLPAFESSTGLKFFESMAIARYVDAKNGGKLSQINDLEKYAIVENWISVCSANFEKHASIIVHELWVKDLFFKQPADAAEVKKGRDQIEPVLDVYEKRLSDNKFLAGTELSLADLFHLRYGPHLFRLMPDLLETRPNLKQWWENLSSLPSWKKTLEMFK